MSYWQAMVIVLWDKIQFLAMLNLIIAHSKIEGPIYSKKTMKKRFNLPS